MDAKNFERLYKEIRREYLKRLVTSEQLFIRPDHLAGRTRWLATELLKKIGRFYESDVEFMKNVVRKRLRELPFGTKHYESLSDCKIMEISFESGIHGSVVLSNYLKNANRIYLVSPFMSSRDIKHIYDLACGIVNKTIRDIEYKVITNKPVHSEVAEVRVFDVHAKFIVTDSVAIVGSMNFNEDGLKRGLSYEIVFITRDKKFVEDLTKRFLWWWDLAGEIEEIRRKVIS